MDCAGSPLRTRDTVDVCTPTALAMSTSLDARRWPPGDAPSARLAEADCLAAGRAGVSAEVFA